MAEWQSKSLGEIVDVEVGPAFKSAEFTDDPMDVRLLRGINVGVGEIKWSAAKYWPMDAAGSFDRFRLRPGDVVLAMDRPWIEAGLKIASVRAKDCPVLLVQRVARLRARNGFDQQFVRAIAGTPRFREYLRGITSGTAVPHISASDIRGYRLRIPAEMVQRRIASVLSAFDDLIEANERRIELLEDLSRSLYREWFVYFRFPGHEATDLVNSKLGLIPDGWVVRKVETLANLHRQSIKPAAAPADTFEHFSLPAFDSDELPVLELGHAIKSAKYRVEQASVLFAKLNPRIRRVWYAEPCTNSAVASTEFLVWTGTNVSNAWLWSLFSSDAFRRNLIGSAIGTSTSHQRIKPTDLENQDVALASRPLMEAFDSVVEPALGQVVRLREQNRQLGEVKNLLLPRLVTGMLDISELDLGTLTPVEVR